MSSGVVTVPHDTSRERDVYAPTRELSLLPGSWRSLPRAFVHRVRADWSRTAMADSTGARLTYGETLIRALVLARAGVANVGNRQSVSN